MNYTLKGDKSKSRVVTEPRLSPDLQIGEADSVFMGAHPSR